MRLLPWLLALSLIAPGVQAKPAPQPTVEQQVLEIIRRNPQVILEAVAKYREDQGRNQQFSEWQQNLAKPVVVDVTQAPSLGPADALYTLVEFSDFECPFCFRATNTIKTLMEKYKGQMRLVYLHWPLPTHEQARPAALAAWAAQQQGKFFEYHDRLFALQTKLTPEAYVTIAKDLGLDLAKFNQDRESPQALAQVEADFKQGEQLGVQGTPTFVLNGVVVRGARPLADFETVIKLLATRKKSS